MRVRYDPEGNMLPSNIYWRNKRHYVLIRASEKGGYRKIHARSQEAAINKLRELRARCPDKDYYATIGSAAGRYVIEIGGKQTTAHSYQGAIEQLIKRLASV